MMRQKRDTSYKRGKTLASHRLGNKLCLTFLDCSDYMGFFGANGELNCQLADNKFVAVIEFSYSWLPDCSLETSIVIYSYI